MSAEPLPPYTHIPGRTPHPVSDPAGHSFGRHIDPPKSFDPSQWSTCREYRRGIDLFNAGYYWEAHEEWESLWHAAGRRGPVADFFKALIQLAVCGVKHYQQMPKGLQTHAWRAAELFRECCDAMLLGLEVARLVEIAEHLTRDGWPAERPQLVPVVNSGS